MTTLMPSGRWTMTSRGAPRYLWLLWAGPQTVLAVAEWMVRCSRTLVPHARVNVQVEHRVCHPSRSDNPARATCCRPPTMASGALPTPDARPSLRSAHKRPRMRLSSATATRCLQDLGESVASSRSESVLRRSVRRAMVTSSIDHQASRGGYPPWTLPPPGYPISTNRFQHYLACHRPLSRPGAISDDGNSTPSDQMSVPAESSHLLRLKADPCRRLSSLCLVA